MGQTSSVQQQQSTIGNDELLMMLHRKCASQLQPIEQLMLRQNMVAYDKDKNQLITQHELTGMLGLPEDMPHLSHLLFQVVNVVGRYPLMSTTHSEGLNYCSLVRALVLLNKERCAKVFPHMDILKVMFIALASGSSQRTKPVSDSQTLIYSANGSIAWDELPVANEEDNLDIPQMVIPADDLLEIMAFFLAIARFEAPQSLSVYSESLHHFDKYKKQAFNILKTMNTSVKMNSIDEFTVNYEQLSTVVTSVASHLFDPLKFILEQLLYSETTDEKAPPVPTISRLVNEFTLSQLSTFLKPELVYSRIRKLYVGSDSGFSMRSFESKAFKWNAPTILLIKGKRVSDKNTNPRYKKFDENFPRYKGGVEDHATDSDELIYGVYLEQPWKITNKDTFGTPNTMIFQISPVQRIFESSISAKHFVYFNTLGGGIGFGSEQPKLKNNFIRYSPGNVSLTLDASLEFAVFRHLGLGGEFRSKKADEVQQEWEDRFILSDVEVWGCGGAKELADQNKQWEWEQKDAKRRQQIDLKSLGEDRALLEMAGLIGQHQSGGSV